MIHWKKKTTKDNEGNPLKIWASDSGKYTVCLNINDGRRWLFETAKIVLGTEVHIGTAPTLKAAKELAECDADGM